MGTVCFWGKGFQHICIVVAFGTGSSIAIVYKLFLVKGFQDKRIMN